MSEIPDIEQRLRAFANGLDEADWNDVLRRAGEHVPAQRPSRRRRAVAFAVVAAAVSLAGISAALGPRTSAPTDGVTGSLGPVGVQGAVGALGPTGSVGATGAVGVTGAAGATGGDGATGAAGPSGARGPHAHQITLDELRAKVPYLPLPNTALANDGNIESVVDSAEGWFTIRYPGSIRLQWTPSENIGCGDYGDAELQTIDGVMAIVHKDYTGPGAQELCLPDGPRGFVELRGPVPVDTLIAIARTLSPSPGDASPDGDLPPASAPSGSAAWDAFFEGGTLTNIVSRESVDAAAGSLAFQPVAPSSLGDPSGILETDPASALRSDRVLSLRYDDPSGGPRGGRLFWLIERPSASLSTGPLSEIAHYCSDDPSDSHQCFNGATVDLGGGVSGIQFQAWNETDKTVWVEGGVFFEIVGSTGDANPDTLWPDEALPVAKTVADAASG